MSVSGSTKPIYFYNVFWGKVHRESFLRECASSLLAPNNLPILKKNPNNRYIIATTQEDWKSIMNDEIFIQLNQYIQTCLLYTSPSPRDATLSRMPASA